MKVKHRIAASVFLAALNCAPALAAVEREVNYVNAVADIVVIRPVGMAVTLIGTALFVASSPLTGLASIAPPHDAAEIAAHALILSPAAFTFARPVGEFGGRYDGLR